LHFHRPVSRERMRPLAGGKVQPAALAAAFSGSPFNNAAA
jgi:hypothetical protein